MNPRTVRFVFVVASVLLAIAILAPAEAEAQTGPYQYYAVTPCRLYDTRTGTPSAQGTGGGILATITDPNADNFRRWRARGACGIPTTAKAMTVNFSLVTPTAPAGGVIQLCPSPMPTGYPCRAIVTYNSPETLANGGLIPLGDVTTPGTDDDIMVRGSGYSTPGIYGNYTFHVTLDVTGYFQ